jgi:hypothetical protein
MATVHERVLGLCVCPALQDSNRSPQMEQLSVCRSTSCPSSETAHFDVQDNKGSYLTVPGTRVNIATCSHCFLYCARMLAEPLHCSA